jgi:acyl-CoA thioesterase
VTRIYKDGLGLEIAFRPELANGYGTLHGGVSATMIDSAMGLAVIVHSGGRPTNTVEMKVNFLRPGVGEKFHCRSRLTKTGKTLVFGEAEVRDRHGKLVATGTATYIFLDLETPRGA